MSLVCKMLIVITRRFRFKTFQILFSTFSLIFILNCLRYFSSHSAINRKPSIIDYRLDHKIHQSLWYHRRMTETENYPLFFYDQVNNWKKILFWTEDSSGGARTYAIGGLGADIFRRNGCPVWQCEAYDYFNTSNIPVEDFDAIVIHDPSWQDREFIRPSNRSPNQLYIFWTQEAPPHRRTIEQWNALPGFFNLTMTHRWDSDVVHPNGWISPVDPEIVPMNPDSEQLEQLIDQGVSSGENYAAGKTKMVAWLVSNCGDENGRIEYAQHLNKFINVDIYGKCGMPGCPEDKDGSCRRNLLRPYKFYLSFENSLCDRLVSEKIFRALNDGVVPIVLDVHGNYGKQVPPHSYINALDFPSVRQLADYLVKLDQNDSLYNRYFWWKNHFRVHMKDEEIRRGLCRLCSILHEPKTPRRIYQNLTEWWYHQVNCQDLYFLKHSMHNSSNSLQPDPVFWITSPVL